MKKIHKKYLYAIILSTFLSPTIWWVYNFANKIKKTNHTYTQIQKTHQQLKKNNLPKHIFSYTGQKIKLTNLKTPKDFLANFLDKKIKKEKNNLAIINKQFKKALSKTEPKNYLQKGTIKLLQSYHNYQQKQFKNSYINAIESINLFDKANQNQLISTKQKKQLKHNQKASQNFKKLVWIASCHQLDKWFGMMFEKVNKTLNKLEKNLIKQTKNIKKQMQNTNDQKLQKCLKEMFKSANKSYMTVLKLKKKTQKYQQNINNYILNSIDNPTYCTIKTKYPKNFINELKKIKKSLDKIEKQNKNILTMLQTQNQNTIKQVCKNRKNYSDKISKSNNQLNNSLNKLDQMTQKQKKQQWKQKKKGQAKNNQKNDKKAPSSQTPNHKEVPQKQVQEKTNKVKEKAKQQIEKMNKIKKWWNYNPKEYIDKLFQNFQGDDKYFQPKWKKSDWKYKY